MAFSEDKVTQCWLPLPIWLKQACLKKLFLHSDQEIPLYILKHSCWPAFVTGPLSEEVGHVDSELSNIQKENRAELENRKSPSELEVLN